jgi:hypothetical protein
MEADEQSYIDDCGSSTISAAPVPKVFMVHPHVKFGSSASILVREVPFASGSWNRADPLPSRDYLHPFRDFCEDRFSFLMGLHAL